MTIEEILAQEEAAQREYEARETFQGFIVADLRKVFEKIADPDDWKGPLCAVMPGEAVNAAVAAIQYFTATTPTVSLVMNTMKYVVESAGYRQGPAGDH